MFGTMNSDFGKVSVGFLAEGTGIVAISPTRDVTKEFCVTWPGTIEVEETKLDETRMDRN